MFGADNQQVGIKKRLIKIVFMVLDPTPTTTMKASQDLSPCGDGMV